MSVSSWVPNIFACMLSSSKPSSVMSNMDDKTPLSSACAAICCSCSLPHSPVLSLSVSRSVIIVSSCSIIARPPAAPCLPKMADNASPASLPFCGTSLSAALTCRITSIVVSDPSRSPAMILSASSPMPRSALCVLVLISRMRLLAVCMSARPWSLKTPDRVCWISATSSSMLMPASRKAGAYCCIFASMSPLRSAPAAKPSLMVLMALAASVPYWAVNLSTACSTSL